MEQFFSDPSIVISTSAAILAIPIIWFLRHSKNKKSAQVRAESNAAEVEIKVLKDSERVHFGLSKTKAFFQQTFDRLFNSSELTNFYDSIEEMLITADVGVDFSEQVVKALKNELGLSISSSEKIKSEVKQRLQRILLALLPENVTIDFNVKPHVIMVVGVNGAGKTTTIAKLIQRFHSLEKRVLVGAADTFRAAATAQLKTWVDRLKAEGVFQPEGSDPSAVAFDSVQAAVSRDVDVCIIDTAGRLHTKSNLMDELAKMKRVITKAMPAAPHDVWLVLDGTMGQNALNQAVEFHKSLGVTGLIITKLDGSAKGGAALAISNALNLPIYYIGVGEAPEDLIPFQKEEFISAILEF